MAVDAQKKLWTLQSSLIDHVRIMVRVPMMFAAPAFLTTSQMKAIQNAVSDVNNSNLGIVWHTHMTRISGIESNPASLGTFATYGRHFGLKDGTGQSVEDLLSTIAQGKSTMVAKAAEAIAFQQMWMDLMGNTILAFLRGTLKGARRKEQSTIFEVIFVVYYFFLYIALAMISSTLGTLPSNKPMIYTCAHMTLATLGSVFIIPFGIVGLIMLPIYIFNGAEAVTLPSRQDYIKLPEDESIPGTYTIDIVKPKQESKVGMRFGSNFSGQTMITNIKPNSIASISDLSIGDTVFSVNGKSLINIPPKDAAQILLNASGVVTIVAAHTDESAFDEEATV